MGCKMDKSSIFIVTRHGVKFHPFNPSPDEMLIEDIAYALSGIRRWGAHASERYTVGQHSLDVARYIFNAGGSLKEQLAGLCHDGVECWLQDIAAPIKNELTQYLEIEANIERVMAAKFGIEYPFPAIVAEADIVCRKHEAQHLYIGHPIMPYTCGCDEFHVMDEKLVQTTFLAKFKELSS